MTHRSADDPIAVHRVRRWFFREGYEYYPDWRKNRGVRRACKRAKETSIEKAEPGLCRVTGRVRVLRHVVCDLLGTEVGAFWGRSMTLFRESVTLRSPLPDAAVRSPIHDTWACGRLAVIDATGVAVVDAHHVSIWRHEGRELMRPPYVLSVSDGAKVTVVGRAERAPAGDVTEFVSARSYRSVPEALVFQGSWRSAVVLLV